MVSRLLRLVHHPGRSVVDRSIGRSSVSMIFACSVFCSYLENVYSYNNSKSACKLMSIPINKTIMRSSFSTNYCIRFELHLIGLRHIINKRKSSPCLCVCVYGCKVRYPRCQHRYWAVSRLQSMAAFLTISKTVGYIVGVGVAFDFPRVFEYRMVSTAHDIQLMSNWQTPSRLKVPFIQIRKTN